MTNHRTKTIIIAFIVFAFLLTGAYALLATNLNITGTATGTASFNISFDSYTVSDPAKATVVANGDRTSLNISANLSYPGDTVTVNFVIKNGGTLAAMVDDITITNNSNADLVVAINGLEDIEGTVLTVNQTLNGAIVIAWNEASTIEDPEPVNFDVTLNYLQAT